MSYTYVEGGVVELTSGAGADVFKAPDGQAVLGFIHGPGHQHWLDGIEGVQCGYSRLPGPVGRRWRDLYPNSFAIFPFFEDLYSMLTANDVNKSSKSKVKDDYEALEEVFDEEDDDEEAGDAAGEEAPDDCAVPEQISKPMLEISMDDNAATLQLAARSGDAVLCKAVQLRSSWESCVDGLGMTPLHLAAAFGHANCMAVLLQGPAKSGGWTVPATPISDTPGPVAADLLRICHPELFDEWKFQLEPVGWRRIDYLHEVAISGSMHHLDFLLQAFEDEAGKVRDECVNHLDYSGQTALDILVSRKQGSDNRLNEWKSAHNALMLKLITAGGRCTKDSCILTIGAEAGFDAPLIDALTRNPGAVDRLKVVDASLLSDVERVVRNRRHQKIGPLLHLDLSGLQNAKYRQAPYLLTRVISLDISSSNFGDRGVSDLVEIWYDIRTNVPDLQHLQYCDLHASGIGDAGAGLLAAAIALADCKKKELTWLPKELIKFLSDDTIRSEGISILQTLDLTTKYTLTEIGVGYLLRALVIADKKIKLHVRLFGTRINIKRVMRNLALTPAESKKLSARVDLLRDQFLLEQLTDDLKPVEEVVEPQEISEELKQPLLSKMCCYDLCRAREVRLIPPEAGKGSKIKQHPFDPLNTTNFGAKARRDRGIYLPGEMGPSDEAIMKRNEEARKRRKNPPEIGPRKSVAPMSEAERLQIRDATLRSLLKEKVLLRGLERFKHPSIVSGGDSVLLQEKDREFLIQETLKIAEYRANEQYQCRLAASQGKDACDVIPVVPRPFNLGTIEQPAQPGEGDGEEGEEEEVVNNGKITSITMKDFERVKKFKMDAGAKVEVAARESDGGFNFELPGNAFEICDLNVISKGEEAEEDPTDNAPAPALQERQSTQKLEVPEDEFRTLNIKADKEVAFHSLSSATKELKIESADDGPNAVACTRTLDVVIVVALCIGVSLAAVSCGPLMRKLSTQLVTFMPAANSISQFQVVSKSHKVSRRWMFEALFLALPVAVLTGSSMYMSFRCWLRLEVSTMGRFSGSCKILTSWMVFFVLLALTACVQFPVALTEFLLCSFNCPGAGGQSGACDKSALGVLFSSPIRFAAHFPPDGTAQGRIDTAMLSACMAIFVSYGVLLWRIEQGKMNPRDVYEARVSDFVVVRGAPGLLAMSLNGTYEVVPGLLSEKLPVFRKETHKGYRWLYAVLGQDAYSVDWRLAGKPPFRDEPRTVSLTSFVPDDTVIGVVETINKRNGFRYVELQGLKGDGAALNGTYTLSADNSKGLAGSGLEEIRKPRPGSIMWKRRSDSGERYFLTLEITVEEGTFWTVTDVEPNQTSSQELDERVLLNSVAELRGASKQQGVSGLMHDGVWRVRVDDHRKEKARLFWVAPTLKASKEHTSAWKPIYGYPLYNLNSVFGLKTFANFASMVLDVALDALVVWSYWNMGLPFFFGIALGIMFAPPLCLWIFMYSLGMMTFFDLFLCLTQTKIFVDAYRTLSSGRKSLDLVWTVVSEACFESAPQSVIQSYCLLLNFSEIAAGGTLFLFSILWSLFNVAKAVAYLDFHGTHTSSGAFAVRLLVRFCEVSSRVSSLALFAMFFRSSTAGLHENRQKAIFILLAIDAFIMWILIHFKAPQGGLINAFWALLSCLVAPPIFVSQFRALQPYYYAVRFVELSGMIVAGVLSGHNKSKLVASKESRFFVGVFLVSTCTFLMLFFLICLWHGPVYLRRLASGRLLRVRAFLSDGTLGKVQFEHSNGTVLSFGDGELMDHQIQPLEMLAGEEVVQVKRVQIQDKTWVKVLTNFGRSWPQISRRGEEEEEEEE